MDPEQRAKLWLGKLTFLLSCLTCISGLFKAVSIEAALIGPSTLNGSFESGFASPWQGVDVVEDAAFASHDQRFAVLQSASTPTARSVCFQDLSASRSNGLTFVLTFDARIGTEPFDSVRTLLSAQNTNGTLVDAVATTLISPVLSTSNWTAYQTQFQLPESWDGVGKISLQIEFIKDEAVNGTTYTAYLDNISLVQIPASYRVVYSFPSTATAGYTPQGRLSLDGTTLYGVTVSGGPGVKGTLFQVNVDGTGFQKLHDFVWNDGANPDAGVVTSHGVLYGTTQSGGAGSSGTLFAVKKDGTGYSVLKSFSALSPAVGGTNYDGAKPRGQLIVDGDTLYGTTFSGGIAGNGTVFKIQTDGSGFAVLKTFSALSNNTNADGANPCAGLLLNEGYLYGTAFYGGVYSNGTVFKVGTNGNNFSAIKHFPTTTNWANAEGANPKGGLVIGDQTLYGTTVNGGRMECGTVFKLKTDGSGYSVLHEFDYYHGAWPHAGLLLNGSTLYGTTVKDYRNALPSGLLFKLNTNGTGFRVLKFFGQSPDANSSYAALSLVGSTLYGAASGGSNGGGAIFALPVAPEIRTDEGNFSLNTNGLNFSITGISNQVVVTECATNLMDTNWLPLQTNKLSGQSLLFWDPISTNAMMRFYRVRPW